MAGGQHQQSAPARTWRRSLLAVALLLAVLTAMPASVRAHSPHDDITDIAVSPSYADDQTIYVISRGRLQRSTDGGERWQDLVRGFGRAPLARIALTPADPDLLFVTSNTEGLFRSTDGGTTWSQANDGIDDLLLREVAASPIDPDLAFVAGGLAGLHRSTDAGDTWTPVPGFGRVTAIAFVGDGSGHVLVGDADGRVSRSMDGGETWESTTPVAGGGEVAAIGVGLGDDASTVVAALGAGQVLRSTDAGATFEAIGDPAPGAPLRGIALDVDDPSTIWVSSADEGPYRTTDDGSSWEAQPSGLTKSEQADEVGVPHFRAIRSTGIEGELLIGGFDGLFRSADGGATWQPSETAGDYVSGLAVSPTYADDDTVVVMTYVKGGFISDDGGETWRTMNGGLRFDELSEGNRLLPLRRGHNIVVSPDFEGDRTIFSATWPQLIRSTDGGESWEAIQIEEPGEDWSPLRQYVLAVSPRFADDGTVYAGNRHGQVFRSEAGGDAGSWAELGPVDGRVRSFAISPGFADDRTLFVGSVGGVFKSTDAGASWQPTGPGRSPLADGGELDPAPMLAMSSAFPSDGTLFAGTESGLFVTRDGGASWQEVDSGPITPDVEVAAVSASPDFGIDGTILVSIRGDGLYRSTDGGTTFEAVGAELAAANRVISDYDNPTSAPIQFSRTFATDRTVFAYAGPDVLRSTDGGETWTVLELPSLEVVAESLGVELDALSQSAHSGHVVAPSDADGGDGLREAAPMVAGAVALGGGLAVIWAWMRRRRDDEEG